MRSVVRATLFALALGAVPAAAFAAPAHAKPMHATLQVTAAFKHKASFMHVMASAKFSYTKHDTVIELTTEGLPPARKLGAKAYVLFVSDGAMKDRAGELMAAGKMASCKHTVMMTKIQDVYLYASKHPGMTRPNGKLVLSGMVG